MSEDGHGDVEERPASVSMPIDTTLVRRLVAAQFPHWAGLTVRPVELSGWDNRTFLLGTGMIVRLPSGAGYAAQVDKEHRWLPALAPHLPLTVPSPLAKGKPAADYPFNWSVYEWIDGENASPERIDDLTEFATALAGFLTALRGIDPTDGPPAGPHSAHRGAPLKTYDAETRRAIGALGGRISGATATAIWDTALQTTWHSRPVWFHGDVAAGNLLVRDGRLAAVIDFGCAGVGDPACDLAIAWSLLSGASRRAFRAALAVDPGTWARGRGWVLWKCLITLAGQLGTDASQAAAAKRTHDEVCAEYAEE